MKEKKIVLVTGFSTRGTGYNRVLMSLFKHWSGEYDIHFVGVGLPSEKLDASIRYYSTSSSQGDILGVGLCEKLIKEIKPSIVLLFNDLLRIVPLIKRLAIYKPYIKLLAYFPMEGELVSPSFVDPLKYLDRIISFTNFGKTELEKAEKLLQLTDPHFLLPPIEIIGHGVDVEIFKPSGKINQLEKKIPRHLADQFSLTENSFIVLNANQFQPRKQIRTTLEGFCLFSKDKHDDVKLILHHTLLGHYDRETVHKLIKQVDDYYCCKGLFKKRVIVSPPMGIDALEEEDLVDLYRLSDVGVNTSAGEGWGLISFEHASTGAAQIVPKHSSCYELWAGAALFLDINEPLEIPGDFPMQLYRLCSEQLADLLEKIYKDRRLLSHISHLCYERATTMSYQWSCIAQKWKILFDTLMRENSTLTPLPVHFNFRANTIDSSVFRMVINYNEYRLPEKFEQGDIVIDVGAHIGCFSYMALSKGAKVFAFEPDRENYEMLNRHLDIYIKQHKLVLFNAALWSSKFDKEATFISCYPQSGWNTGGGTVIDQKTGQAVNTIDFDEMINRIIRKEKKGIRLLKLDCEGAEWAILLGSKKLSVITEICGEFHEYNGMYDNLSIPNEFAQFSKLTSTELENVMTENGFDIEVDRRVTLDQSERIGLFFAKKSIRTVGTQ